MSDLTIRRYRPDDRERVLSVMETALRNADAYVEDAPALQEDDIRETYVGSGGDFLVGTVRGEVVATAAFRPVSERIGGMFDDWVNEVGSRTAELKRMHVHPAHQRRGYASEVLSELETRARNSGFDAFVLETTEMQAAAADFYRSHGFELVAREPVSFDERSFVLHYYRKDLRERSE